MQSVPTPPEWSRDIFSVGVTGTNGKTTTTAQIAAILEATLPVAAGGGVFRATTVGYFLGNRELTVERSYEGFIGALDDGRQHGCRYAALEMTSEALARGFARAWPCRVGVFTNLTHDHLDAHQNPEHYLASKAQLFVTLPGDGTAVLNAADETAPLLREILPNGVRVLSYATLPEGGLEALALPPSLTTSSVRVTRKGTHALLTAHDPALGLDRPVEVHVRGIGVPFMENGMAAILGAYAAGAPLAAAIEALAGAPVPPGRFELVDDAGTVAVDYAHTPDAIERTLATARALAQHVTVVFGAGGDRDKAKRPLMGRAASSASRVVITTDNPRSEDPRAIADAIAAGVEGSAKPEIVLDRKEAIRRAILEAPPGGLVLLLGKGHEKVPFSDVDVAREVLAAK